MKTFKLALLLVAFAFSLGASATTTPKKKKKKKAQTIERSIGRLLENPKFNLKRDIDTSVYLIVNSDNELVVLNVESDDYEVETWVKLRLNYKKLDFDFAKKNKPLRLPLRMVSR
ncbi:hypothetical protein [Winogradskyella sp. 3972H.M.0a.05]|uniref:hypothetical protein n=1 Tax=Winogradskyella sp. 3972H.M.0a.05 TaxID=2950277 RepID=UPI003397566F